MGIIGLFLLVFLVVTITIVSAIGAFVSFMALFEAKTWAQVTGWLLAAATCISIAVTIVTYLDYYV